MRWTLIFAVVTALCACTEPGNRISETQADAGRADIGVDSGIGVAETLTMEPRTTTHGAGSATFAFSTPEHTILRTTDWDFSEPAGSVLRGPGGSTDWQTVVLSNVNAAENDRHDYGCWRDGYATKCDYNGSWYTQGVDPTVDTDTNGTDYFYALTLTPDREGVQLKRSANPCPDGCGSASWNACIWNDIWTSPKLDFTQLIDDPGSENMWFLGDLPSDTLVVGRIVPLCSNLTWWTPASGCSGLATDEIGRARGVIVEDDIWIVYYNWTQAEIEFIKFDTVSKSFDCGSRRGIAPLRQPGQNCECPTFPDCPDACPSTSTLRDITRDGEECLRASKYPEIDVSSRFSSTPNAVIALNVAAEDAGSSCNGKQTLRIYRSIDGGSTWSWRIVTGCQNAPHPDVAFNRTPGTFADPETVHVMNMHEAGSADDKLRPVRWKSTDGGASWSGVYIGSSQSAFPRVQDAGPCYWGDYQGLVADRGNDTMYYFWGNGDVEADWVIRGEAVEP